MIIIIIDKPETPFNTSLPMPYKIKSSQQHSWILENPLNQYRQSRIYLIDHLKFLKRVRFWSNMEEWNFVNSGWALFCIICLYSVNLDHSFKKVFEIHFGLARICSYQKWCDRGRISYYCIFKRGPFQQLS